MLVLKSTPMGDHFPMTSVGISPAHYVHFGATVSCLAGQVCLISVDVIDVIDVTTWPADYLFRRECLSILAGGHSSR